MLGAIKGYQQMKWTPEGVSGFSLGFVTLIGHSWVMDAIWCYLSPESKVEDLYLVCLGCYSFIVCLVEKSIQQCKNEWTRACGKWKSYLKVVIFVIPSVTTIPTIATASTNYYHEEELDLHRCRCETINTHPSLFSNHEALLIVTSWIACIVLYFRRGFTVYALCLVSLCTRI